jgi:hypothetical protein
MQTGGVLLQLFYFETESMKKHHPEQQDAEKSVAMPKPSSTRRSFRASRLSTRI